MTRTAYYSYNNGLREPIKSFEGILRSKHVKNDVNPAMEWLKSKNKTGFVQGLFTWLLR